MKLTKEKLYKLILEELSSSEEKFYGSGVAQMSKVINSNGNWKGTRWFKKNIGKELGAGAYRTAYELGKDKVVKIAYGHEEKTGKQVNYAEAKLFNQFPAVFPKAYAYDPNGKWMICEAVDVITDRDEFWEALFGSFPVLTEIISVLQKEIDNSDLEIPIRDEFFEHSNKGKTTLWKILKTIFHFNFEKNKRENKFKKELLDWRFEKESVDECWRILSHDNNRVGKNLLRWFDVIKRLKIELFDIRHDNVGFTKKDKKFVIIDISIFYNELSEIVDKIKKSGTKGIGSYDLNKTDNRGLVSTPMKESLRDDHKEKLIKLLLSNIEGAEQAFDLMRGLELSKQEISALVFPQLPSMLLKSLEYAEFAIRIMDDLGLEDITIIDIINDAIKSDPIMSKTPTGWGNPLQQRLSREINMRLMRGLEGFDLGDFNEW